MSVFVGDVTPMPSSCYDQAATETAARKLRRRVGERQLQFCPSLLCGMSDLVRRQLALRRGEALRREEIDKETETFRRMVSGMQKLSKQHAGYQRMQQLQRTEHGTYVLL